MPTRWDPPTGPSERVAVVLPGSGYSPSHPLLEFGRQALLQHGWTVQQVWWDQPDDDRDEDAWVRWVCEQARAVAEREQGASKLLFLGKSLGTLAAPYVAGLVADAVWLTPLLRQQAVVDGIAANARAGARQLLVGGTEDPQWDGEVARGLGAEVLEVPDATHFFHVPGDAVRSVEMQVEVSRALDAFLRR